MSDPIPHYYQPDQGVAERTGRRADPMTNVDKPIAMKLRVTAPRRPNTPTKHYRRRKATSPTYDERRRIFF